MPASLALLLFILLIWAAVAVISWRFPEPARKWWRAWNRLASALARKKALSYGFVASLPLLLRALLLALWPIPDPYVQDEFSYLLQADTFAHGRLTNASPPLAEFFESGQILVQPSYASKYPPGHSLVMSIGQRLFGNPWFGVWLSCGALAAALLWALEGWFPFSWALFGTLLALPLCSFSYWMNSYMGGAVAAIGGALVVGAYPRLAKKNLVRKKDGSAWTLASGCVLLLLTRPYEGLLIVVPTLVCCLLARISVGSWARIAGIALAGAAVLGYYNQRVTGDPFRLPYFEYQAQYQATPQFNVQSPALPKQIRYEGMRLIDQVWERTQWENARRPRFLVDRPLQWVAAAGMFAGATGSFLPVIALRASVVDQNAVFNLNNLVHIFLMGAMVLIPVVWFAWPLATNRRTRFAFALVAASIAGSFFSAAFYQHYAAPAVAPILVLITGAYRYLRLVGQVPDLPGSRQVGDLPHIGGMLALLIPVCAIGLSLLDGAPALLREPAVFKVATRSRLEEIVKEHPGKHLIIVRYTPPLRPIEEWVYNGADLDQAQVIWSHDLGSIENRRLTAHFHDREVWLFQPNIDPDWIAPYRE